jgi:flagella basal body P-ring formation protein FlgA
MMLLRISGLGGIITALALLLAAPAFAGTPVMLNPNLSDAPQQITLGELFDDAGAARDVVVAERTGPTVVLDAAALQLFARRYGLDWSNPQGLRRVILRGQGALGSRRGREVLTWAHNIVAGEVIQPEDLIWSKTAGEPVDAPAGVDAVVGMAARRPMREGDAVQAHDITPAMMITAGDTVMVTYSDEGVTLTLEAKAMANAAAGESLNVLNPTSKKLVAVLAIGPDQAVVGPEALRIRSQRNPSQLAYR